MIGAVALTVVYNCDMGLAKGHVHHSEVIGAIKFKAVYNFHMD